MRRYGIEMAGALLLALGLGCGTRPGNEIPVGVLLPLTGPHAAYGDSLKKGLVLALAEELARTDAAPLDVRLLYRDTHTGPEGLQALDELLSVHAVPVVLSSSNEVTLACATRANEKKTILLSPSATAADISGTGPWVYRTAGSEVQEAIAMAQHCIQTGRKRVAVFYPDDAYGSGLAQLFRQGFEERGGTVIPFASFSVQSPDFGDLLTQASKGGAQAVYLPAHQPEILAYLEAAQVGNAPLPLLSSGALHLGQLLEQARVPLEGVVFTQPAFAPQTAQGTARRFVEAFQARYGRTPDLYAASAYDAGRVLLAAIRVGGRDPVVVQRALDAMGGFDGVLGQTTFDNNGDVSRVPQIYTVRDGAIVRLP